MEIYTEPYINFVFFCSRKFVDRAIAKFEQVAYIYWPSAKFTAVIDMQI